MFVSKKEKIKALKKVGVDKKAIKDFEKSSAEVLKAYYGRESYLVTSDLLEKCYALINKRKEIGVEVAGMIFQDNLTVTFIYFVDGNPEEAFFDRDIFWNVEEFEKELDFQLCENYIPDLSGQRRIFYKEGMYIKLLDNKNF